ncbi:hypothetical protein JZO86_13370 [Enterococcus ureasiticus]|uniref:hypothetical protein n=1 Tax=Enterococcus ureasiticus TaxID=903984 RepID=UPI001A901E77|nr:hypothetical protein [Enterococcus ureasiticus]MBO0474686.1 hypothetical protein [Enterococcus ureasiticus]
MKIQTTESKEVVNYWLDQWGTSKADGMKQVRVNYNQMYAEIIGEISIFKVIETMSEIPKKED